MARLNYCFVRKQTTVIYEEGICLEVLLGKVNRVQSVRLGSFRLGLASNSQFFPRDLRFD